MRWVCLVCDELLVFPYQVTRCYFYRKVHARKHYNLFIALPNRFVLTELKNGGKNFQRNEVACFFAKRNMNTRLSICGGRSISCSFETRHITKYLNTYRYIHLYIFIFVYISMYMHIFIIYMYIHLYDIYINLELVPILSICS